MKKEMTTLDKILSEIKPSELTQQMMEFSDRIMKEETPRMKNIELAPKGPNKFITLEVPGLLRNEIGFVTLEREAEEDYIVVYWTYRPNKPDRPLKKVKVHQIEGDSAKKILYQFAKLVKFYRGEEDEKNKEANKVVERNTNK